MNDDQARIVRLYQYLLSKDVFIKNSIIDREKLIRRKNLYPDDFLALYLLYMELEIWQNLSREVWKLIK